MQIVSSPVLPRTCEIYAYDFFCLPGYVQFKSWFPICNDNRVLIKLLNTKLWHLLDYCLLFHH